MGREWAELSATISAVDARWKESARLTYRTAVIVRVHMWSVHHDRPTCWACEKDNWEPRKCPKVLPDQSTMSRRMRGKHARRFESFLDALSEKLGQPLPQDNARQQPAVDAQPAEASAQDKPPQAAQPPLELVKILDGKPLPVAAHSQDRNATWGRGAGQQAKGYKLHMVVSAKEDRPMPLQWAVAPLNVDERVIATRLIKRLEGGGYLLTDANYEATKVYRHSAAANHQMFSPRKRVHVKNKAPMDKRRRCAPRVRSVEALEPPADINCFGPEVYRLRRKVESAFGNLTSFGGGLQGLPSWARRIWRVRRWVYGKLLINACRIRRRKAGRA
jgi:hypothetical protein